MPCHSWGVPAQDCGVGSVLAKVEGTTCHDCYALKRAYAWPRVRKAYQRRRKRADDPDWVAAMVTLVRYVADSRIEAAVRRGGGIGYSFRRHGHYLALERADAIFDAGIGVSEGSPGLEIRGSSHNIGRERSFQLNPNTAPPLPRERDHVTL